MIKNKTELNKKTPAGSVSMGDLLKKYSSTSHVITKGTKITGTILRKIPNMLVLDIGGKSEGIVAEKAYEEARGFIENLEEGDKVEVQVISSENQDGYTIVSLRQAAAKASWDKLVKAKNEGTLIKVQARFLNPSGVMVESGGLFGFIPNTQLSKKALKNKDNLIGKEFYSIIIEVDKDSNRLIFSEKAASEGITPKIMSDAANTIKEGEVYEGVVTTVSDFGAFVEIIVKMDEKEVSVEGLVHVSEISWDRVKDPHTVLSKGDKVKVKVIGTKSGKLALSMKQALKDPWDEVEKNYKVEQKILGKVTKTTDFGVFVQLEPGIEGLVHITKIPPDHKIKTGDEVNAVIEEVDSKQRKISLGLVLTQKPLLYK